MRGTIWIYPEIITYLTDSLFYENSGILIFFEQISDRRSRPRVFFKKAVLKNFEKSTGVHLC